MLSEIWRSIYVHRPHGVGGILGLDSNMKMLKSWTRHGRPWSWCLRVWLFTIPIAQHRTGDRCAVLSHKLHIAIL